VAPGGHWQANRSSNENHSLLARVNAARLADSWSHRMQFRNRGSPQLARAVTAEITQNINSPSTGAHNLLFASSSRAAIAYRNAISHRTNFLRSEVSLSPSTVTQLEHGVYSAWMPEPSQRRREYNPGADPVCADAGFGGKLHERRRQAIMTKGELHDHHFAASATGRSQTRRLGAGEGCLNRHPRARSAQ
jgi:hypothetical protein